MNDQHDEFWDELHTPTLYPPPFDRRDFLQAAGGLIVLATMAGCALGQGGEGGAGRPNRPGRPGGGGRGAPNAPLASWLQIDEQGKITACVGKVEIGQNIRTSLAMVVAEELRVPLAAITMIMGDTDKVPYDMGTFGSQTTPTIAPVLRRSGAAAREALLDLAAARFQVDRAGLTVADGQVRHAASGRTASYGELTAGAKLVHTLDGVTTTPHADWKVAGRRQPRLNGHASVTGAQRFPSDIARPGMLHGKILRPPGYGAKLQKLDSSAAEAMPGVKVVHDGDFVGVTAPNDFLAAQALAALKAEWSAPSGPANADLPALFRATPLAPSARVADALGGAEVKIEATYTVAYIAHTPMEPRAGVAEFTPDGNLHAWVGTQQPFGARSILAQWFHLDESRVHVQMPDMGGGFGGKHGADGAIEAARLAKVVGAPVKVNWTREEEYTWAYFRPYGAMDVHAGARRDGTLVAWEYHNYNSGGPGIDTPYDVGAKNIGQHGGGGFGGGGGPLPQGSYRALATTGNVFARETAMDELAAACGMDPLAFRLKNLSSARLKGVLQAAAAKFGWNDDAKRPAGHGRGIACAFDKGSFVATAAEVVVTGKEVRVVRAVTAFDCGVVNNPGAVVNQCQGAISMGLGGALFEHIRFAGGQILNGRLSDYRVPRFSDMPEIEVVLVQGDANGAAGAGETPITAIAAAVGNAIFAATGTRLRDMPLRL
jgi:isoquinoline 1-oxidoreductase